MIVAEYIARRAIKSKRPRARGGADAPDGLRFADRHGRLFGHGQQVLRNIIASQEKRVTIDLIQKRVSGTLQTCASRT